MTELVFHDTGCRTRDGVDVRGGGYRGDDSVVDDAVALLEIRAVGVTVAVVVARVVRGVDDDVADAHQVVEQCLIRGRVNHSNLDHRPGRRGAANSGTCRLER